MLQEPEEELNVKLQRMREEIFAKIPNKDLKIYLNFQRDEVKEDQWWDKMCCCFRPRCLISGRFRRAFRKLTRDQQLTYYKKSIYFSHDILHKSSRVPQSLVDIGDRIAEEKTLDILAKGDQFDEWIATKAIISSGHDKMTIFQREIIKLDDWLMRIEIKEQNSLIVLESTVEPICLYLKGSLTSFTELKMELEKVLDERHYKRLVQMIEKSMKIIQSSQAEQPNYSERALVLSEEVKVRIQELTRQMRMSKEIVNYLKVIHPTNFGMDNNQITFLYNNLKKPYFFENEWDIESDGKLLMINQSKLDAQSSVIKYLIKRLLSGAKVLSISLPVTVFNQFSNLSLLLSSFRFAPLILPNASKIQDPLQRFKQIIRFSLTYPICYIKTDKPFNPILGETYQMKVGSTVFYGEQISHHPPVSSIFVKGDGYVLYGTFQAQVQFGLNTASGCNAGYVCISFDERNMKNKLIKYTNFSGQMKGLVLGKRRFRLTESVHYIDEQNLLFCELKVNSIEHQKKVKCYYDSIQGIIYKMNSLDSIKLNQKWVRLGLVHGRWLDKIYFDDELIFDIHKEIPPQIDEYLGLLQSDVNLRQDIILKVNGKIEQAQIAKQQLEESQRNDRKLRQRAQKNLK